MLSTAMEKEKKLTSLNQDTENRKKQFEKINSNREIITYKGPP